jgi:hypothetical protein
MQPVKVGVEVGVTSGVVEGVSAALVEVSTGMAVEVDSRVGVDEGTLELGDGAAHTGTPTGPETGTMEMSSISNAGPVHPPLFSTVIRRVWVLPTSSRLTNPPTLTHSFVAYATVPPFTLSKKILNL